MVVFIEVEVAAQTRDSFQTLFTVKLKQEIHVHLIPSAPMLDFPQDFIVLQSVYANCMNFYAPPSHPTQGSEN